MLVDMDLQDAVVGQHIIKNLIIERTEMITSRNFDYRRARRMAQSAFGDGMMMEEATDGYSLLIFSRELLKEVRV